MAEQTDANPVTTITPVPVEKVRPSSHQVRRHFDEAGIKTLADSILKEGLLQPVTVRRLGDEFELIAGERRWRAVKLLGQPTLPAIVIEVASEAAASAKSLVENVQRKDLNAIEEAEGFANLAKLDPGYWTQEMIGTIAGRDRTYVNKSIALLALPEPLLETIRQETLSREHGLELLRLEGRPEQAEVGERAKALTVKKTRDLIDSILGKAKSKEAAPQEQGPQESSFRFSKKNSELIISGRFPLDTDMKSLCAFLCDSFSKWEKKTKKVPPPKSPTPNNN